MQSDECLIDFAQINDEAKLHQVFFDRFNFPGWYGFNWDALWDAITALVELPNRVQIINFASFRDKNPKKAEVFLSIIEEYNNQIEGKMIEILN